MQYCSLGTRWKDLLRVPPLEVYVESMQTPSLDFVIHRKHSRTVPLTVVFRSLVHVCLRLDVMLFHLVPVYYMLINEASFHYVTRVNVISLLHGDAWRHGRVADMITALPFLLPSRPHIEGGPSGRVLKAELHLVCSPVITRVWSSRALIHES